MKQESQRKIVLSEFGWENNTGKLYFGEEYWLKKINDYQTFTNFVAI